MDSIARASNFPVLLAAVLVSYSASGAFVSLVQTSLILGGLVAARLAADLLLLGPPGIWLQIPRFIANHDGFQPQ